MKHYTPSFTRRNVKAYAAAVLSYLLLVGQLTPLALAANSKPRVALPTDVARESAGESPRIEAAAAPAPLAAPAAPAAFAPTITATKTDSYAGAPAAAPPGTVITYTVTINNSGPDPATNLTLNDTVDPNTTIVPGSAVASPIATDETYNVIGNVRIQPNAAQGLLTNDNNPNTGNTSGLTASGPTTGPSNGQATVNGDGSFTYNPNPGFNGTDTFTYTVTSANGSDTATVTLKVGDGAGGTTGVIWFVDDTAAAGGDGRLTSPFNCYTGTSVPAASTCFSDTAADEAGDAIFLYDGAYAGGNTLLNTQKLVGQDASASLAAIAAVTVPAYSDPLPATDSTLGGVSITTTTANAIPLGQGNTLRGFTVGNTGTGAKIVGTNFGTLTVGNSTTPDVALSGTGKALDLATGTFAATSAFAGVATTSSTDQGVELAGVGGTVSFGSTSVSGSLTQGILVGTTTADINFGNTSVTNGTDAISLQNNSSGTRTFGTINTASNTGVGFLHGAGGGTVNVTGAAIFTNPGGNGIDIDSSNANVTFAATTVNKNVTGGTGVDLTNNASRTIAFAALTITVSNGVGLNANASGTVNNTGGSITATGTGAAATLTNTALGLTFTSVSSNGGANGLVFTGGSGTFASGTTNLQNNGGIGLLMQTASAVAANFGNTTVNSSAGDAVDISGQTGNVTFADLDLTPDSGLRGLDVATTTGTITSTSGDIATTGAPAINISGPAGRTPLALALTDVSATNSSTPGVDINLVSGSLSVPSAGTGTDTNIANPTGIGLQVRNSTANFNFGDTTVSGSGGTGVVLGTASNGNTGTFTFNDLDISPDNAQRAFHAVQNTGQINTTTGTFTTVGGAVNVEIVGTSAASRTPLNMTLEQVGVGGTPTSGIIITNTSAPSGAAGFRVNGTGTTDGSGGAIANAGGDAVLLTDAERIVLKNFNIGDAAAANNETQSTQVVITDDGISSTRVTEGAGGTYGLDLDNVKIADTGNHGINGSGGGNVGLRFINGEIINAGNDAVGVGESAMWYGTGFPTTDQITGTVTITNSIFGAFYGYGFSVENAGTGTLNMTVSGCTYQNNDSTGIGDSGIQIIADGSQVAGGTGPTVNLHVLNTNFTNIDLDGVEVTTDPGATTNVTIDGGTTNSPNGDNAFHLNSGSVDNNDTESSTNLIKNVTVNAMRGSIIFLKSGAGTYHATVQDSTLNSGNTTNGAGAHLGRAVEILFDADHDPANSILTNEVINARVRVHNVTMNNIGVDGVHVGSNEIFTGSTFNAIVTNNTIGTAAAPVGRSDTGEGVEMIFQNSTANVLVQSNTINTRGQTTTSEGVDIDAEVGATVNATVLSNTITQTLAINANALDANTEVAGTTMCLDMRTNTATGGLGNQYQLANAGTFNYELAGAGPVTAAEIQAQQTSGTVSINSGTINKNGGANCPEAQTPNTPTLPSAPVESTSETDAVAPGGGPAYGGAVVAPTSDGANVTSRPFVSPILRNKAQAAQPVIQQRAASALKAAAQTKGGAAQGGGTKSAAPATQLKKDAPATKSGAKGDAPGFNPPSVNGDTLTWNIGTLPANSSVTITFQVTVDNPFLGAQPQVSNQGTVTADGGVNVLTDDPDVAGANNPTVTPILATNISVNDAKQAEPTSGSANMVFTIALSSPSGATVSVNFATEDEPAGPGKAVAGQDYTPTSGTATFMPGQRIKTVSVPILADADASEPDETFLLKLSMPANGTIVDGTATGTITAANTPGTFLISELRAYGPGSSNDPNDEFIELYNNSDSPVTVAASDSSAGWSVAVSNNGCDGDPVIVGTIPNGTIIPARGHYLLTGSAYSLANYGGTGAAAGNLTLSADMATNANVGVFTTSDIVNLSSVNRLDAVGFGLNNNGVCDLLREGSTANAPSMNQTALGQYSILRDPCGKALSLTAGGLCPTTGNPKDSNDNGADFVLVDPNGTNATGQQRLGAAGPENIASPVRRDATIGIALIDGSQASSTAPNRVRDFTSDPGNNATFGTLSIRRRFVNNTGAPVTRLRFRIVDISTFGPAPGGTADLRAITSTSTTATSNDAATCTASGAGSPPCMVTILGTTLEAPPAQPNGGGFNSTLAAGTITTGTPLNNGASINLQFLLGIQQTGSFKFYFIIEALP